MKEFDIREIIEDYYNKEDVIEQVKDQWWETYGIHLDNSEIKILDE